jgi:hypothetical protein
MLQLSVAWPDDLGREAVLAEGSPLFFTWAGAKRLAAFVGSGRFGGRITLLDSSMTAADVVLPGAPGNFCAPVWLRERVLYVAHVQGKTKMVAGEDGNAFLSEIESVEGLVALVASPDGRKIARAIAPDGDGTPYRHIAIVDVDTWEVRPLIERACLAFAWSPVGDALVVARVDTDRNLLEWSKVDSDGTVHHLIDMYPTRDLGFYLRFFEQYAQSHSIIDPTGQYLLLAGGIAGRDTPKGTPKLWQISLTNGRAEEVGQGLFAVYGPPG